MNNPHDESRSPLARFAAAVMVCNPLLLLSPMCLLYGIYRAVTAPNLFSGDNGNTIFNFIALALYVLMVCVASTLLARKRIIPDATMLLLLHALLFVAPFILIAHGVFLDGDIAMSLGAIGISVCLAQLDILRRRLPESFVSPALMLGGAFILAANFAAPTIFRRGLENDNETWTLAGSYAWNLILPLLVAWMNVLPTQERGSAIWSRAWFGLVSYLTWLGGTVVQLWTIAYVDDRALHPHQFTVALWVLAWTTFRHSNLLSPVAGKVAAGAALLIPALGAFEGLDLPIAAALFALNIPLVALAYGRLPVIAFCGISLMGLLCCLPMDWIQALVPNTSRAEFALVTFGSAVLGFVALLKDARAGLLGALGVAFALAKAEFPGYVVLNAAVFFMFLHQLRWPLRKNEEHFVLGLLGVVWIWNTIGLELSHDEGLRASCMVATVVATICLRQASLGLPTSLAPAIASLVVLCIHPAFWSVRTVAAAPSGVLPIAAGFTLLTAGAWRSLRRAVVGSTVRSEP